MDLLGITLNFMSTMAMSLVAGVLVDDAIVEIENIVRHMRMGKSAYQASIDAADEIGLAVLATTMAIVAVFLPVALMPGISGQFFKAFGFTVVVSVHDEPARRAHDHAAGRGLLPALARRAAARGMEVDGHLLSGSCSSWSLNTAKAHCLCRLRHPRLAASASCKIAVIVYRSPPADMVGRWALGTLVAAVGSPLFGDRCR